jgi:predicted dehydrogenase/threonine dehydrogenase-like Zn-dependent dehydrogenase
MKQLVQNLRTGKSEVLEVPAPATPRGFVCVQVSTSVVSSGTERMIVEFAEKNLLQKARARPDLVRQVLQKLRRDGLRATLSSVNARLDQPMPLGYAASGVVLAAGDDTSFRAGDRVACAGAGFAVHAEVVAVPKNLVARIPDGVDDESAAFATLGAIALHGVRLAEPHLGETAVVIGLGLLGQITVQLLKAAGCRVAGMDPDGPRSELAISMGADASVTSSETLIAAVQQLTDGRGADCVLITADTASSEPVELAATVARDRASVVAVGAVGMTLPRKTYFEKELAFRVSRSYGPGRYDPQYELQGTDYPVGFVRWTEQRNLEAFLQMVADGRITMAPLITHRVPIDRGGEALDLVSGKTGERFLGVVLQYRGPASLTRRIEVPARAPTSPSPQATGVTSVGVLGAGLFATTTLLPALKAERRFQLRSIGASTGLSAAAAARRFAIPTATTSEQDVLSDADIRLVAIASRHRHHARQVIAALDAGKHVFVEKPPCLSRQELSEIESARTRAAVRGDTLTAMVGFNRRWAPMVRELRDVLSNVREPLMLQYRVNAGFLPASHWTQDAEEGGRLIGEGCHFLDVLVDLANSRVREVTTQALPDSGRYRQDNFITTLTFDNGSVGTLTYLANASSAAGKERIEISGGGVTARLEDFRRLAIDGPGNTSVRRSAWLRQDKGHRGEFVALADWFGGTGPEPLPFDVLRHSMQVVFAAAESLALGGTPVAPDETA